MNSKRTVTALLLAPALLASTASAQTVEDVVRRYLEARGGLARLRAVQSLRLNGTVELPGVPPAPFTLELKRPDRMRTEFVIEGRKAVRAYDGRVAWSQLPVPGEPPRPMAAEDAADAKAQADVDLSPLVDAAAKGYTVELVGRDRLPGGETFRLVVRGKTSRPARCSSTPARTSSCAPRSGGGWRARRSTSSRRWATTGRRAALCSRTASSSGRRAAPTASG